MGSYNTLNDLSNKVCVPNKREDLNLSVFNMTIGINQSQILTKHINHAIVNVNLTANNATQIKSEIMINVGGSAKIQMNIMHVAKIIFTILIHVVLKMLNI